MRDYFKGFYFKCSNAKQTVAVIPAFHRNHHQENASLQIITDRETFYIPFHALSYHEKPLSVKIGDSIFSDQGIRLHIHSDTLHAEGILRFSRLSPIRYDIMGPFRFVPFMQCRHRVYSMTHQVNGRITVNDVQYCFRNGKGYIEGDCGRSFPKRYIWTQCSFNQGSIMLSAADIPFLGFQFTGIICVILYNEREYRIATYLGAKVRHIGKNTVIIQQNGYQLIAALLEDHSHPLRAPDFGSMTRTIHESASCKAYYHFSLNGRTICEWTSNQASFEYEYP